MEASFESHTALTVCQQNALEFLNGDKNVFLTGVAGSGKSFLLQHYLKDKNRKSYPVVASTGAAAVLVKGVTFHSFFGLGIMEGGLARTIEKALKDKRLGKRLKRTVSIVIDEISMINGQALLAAEKICSLVRESDLPWGGIKIIAVGDFGQLPPVNAYGTAKDWAFLSDAWTRSEFKVAYLRTVMRSKDEEFLAVLNFIRDGDVNETVTNFLNNRLADPGQEFKGTRLFSHRQSVEDYNVERLEELPGKLEIFKTEYLGASRYLEQIKKSAPIPEVLQLKLGALVMMRKNDPALKFVNGSLGTITDILPNRLDVRLLSGLTVSLEKESFTSLDAEGKEVAVATNFPVNLAWATTIHKSQGITLDAAAMDLSKVFEAGQAYVALSRVRSAEGLFLTAWNPKAIRASSEVKTFHAESIENGKI